MDHMTDFSIQLGIERRKLEPTLRLLTTVPSWQISPAPARPQQKHSSVIKRILQRPLQARWRRSNEITWRCSCAHKTVRVMAGEINEGSVPAYYREVYEAIRCRTDERVQVEVFQRLLQRAGLSKAALSQIAEHVDSTDGFLTKLSLYKALALIAVAQQGKQPSPKLLENYIQELPKPQLGEPRELNALRMQPGQNDVLTISETLEKLLAKDTVQVELIPEKKGLFLKHVEYQVTSQRYKISVYRRYSDFDIFHELLLQKFAYRVVPALPPKRMLKGVLTSVSEREFIEGRRRALGRFINLVARHPLFSEDELVKTFLTFSGSDVQTRLRDTCKKSGDEFMTNRIATQVKEYLPADIQAQFSTSRELIKNIHNSFQRLRDKAEKMAERSKENATDLLQFGRELSALGSDASALPSLASSHSSWGTLRQSLKSLSVEFAVLSDKATQQGRREEDDVVEKLNFFLDLLQSYRDLCERHEKGVLHEHQRALHKYGMMKRQMMSATVQSKEQASVEQLESRIVQQESAIQTMELRNYFSLFCLHQETQLIFTYLPITSHILGAFVNSQVQGHREMGEVWNELQPKLGCLFGSNNGLKPPI
ncbi:sorting nexin [Crenichthys baileyi]|uniref:Sorting nexin n=1 Tax=Crenichthys baileyi TaxID=28760 RepID=A0AAV9RST3_9TELE